MWAAFTRNGRGRGRGKGQAWDGLKYDLAKFSPWHFARLKQFAELAERRSWYSFSKCTSSTTSSKRRRTGPILHGVRRTAFKNWFPLNRRSTSTARRVFMAKTFYDASHEHSAAFLHRRYIRHASTRSALPECDLSDW